MPISTSTDNSTGPVFNTKAPHTMTSTGRYDALLADLANRWPVVAATALVLVAALVLPLLLRKNPLAAIPAVKGGRIRWVRQGWAMYIEGYNKVGCSQEHEHTSV